MGNRHPYLQICVIDSCRTPIAINLLHHNVLWQSHHLGFFLVSVHCLLFCYEAKCALFTLRSIDTHVKMRKFGVTLTLRHCGRDTFLSHFRIERYKYQQLSEFLLTVYCKGGNPHSFIILFSGNSAQLVTFSLWQNQHLHCCVMILKIILIKT